MVEWLLQVFNVDNIKQSMHTIDRLDKPIQTVAVGGRIAVTATRGHTGRPTITCTPNVLIVAMAT